MFCAACNREFVPTPRVGRQPRTCGCGLFSRGLNGHPLYAVWRQMNARCYNPNNEKFNDYGGRGIRVCKKWREDFFMFHAWAVSAGWTPGLLLDRRNNNGIYAPHNCRFVDHQTSIRNTRRTKFTMPELRRFAADVRRGMTRDELRQKHNLTSDDYFNLIRSTTMEQKTIVFTAHGGEVKIETLGFTGPACQAATKAFEQVLGGNITKTELTADYYKKPPVKVTQTQK